MRITQQHKVIRLAKLTAENLDANPYVVRLAMEKVLEAKTVDEKIYAIESLMKSITKMGA